MLSMSITWVRRGSLSLSLSRCNLFSVFLQFGLCAFHLNVNVRTVSLSARAYIKTVGFALATGAVPGDL